ncbi:hypothetical protein [Micromonospora sp. CA-246542]|uniref:hypothetical protein n=1 Tax=Micromonospora sp. CA-246542 TaxID=3239959 RepID=UPI003D8A47BC
MAASPVDATSVAYRQGPDLDTGDEIRVLPSMDRPSGVPLSAHAGATGLLPRSESEGRRL